MVHGCTIIAVAMRVERFSIKSHFYRKSRLRKKLSPRMDLTFLKSTNEIPAGDQDSEYYRRPAHVRVN
jgi:hypothetical protein